MRRPAMRRASAVISSAGRPQIAAAQRGVFRLAVARGRGDRRSKTLPADAVAVEKCAVVQPLGHQRMREAEHQRDIGAGADRMPDRRRSPPADRRAAGRSDGTRRRAGAPRASRARAMCSARAAAADIVVLQRHAAKGEHQRAVARPARPS